MAQIPKVAVSLHFADNGEFEREVGQMLDKLSLKKKAKMCKEFNLTKQVVWREFFCLREMCGEKKDFEGAVQIFRQLYSLLMNKQ